MIYTPDMTLGEARERYFEIAGFGDGGYDEVWINVKVWRLPIWLPNTQGRVAAVKLHDLHHVLTEYPTTWAGEAEIAAWELGSGGLHHYFAGWWLDLMNVAQGLVVNPRGVYRGFMRGRATSNLFDRSFSEEMLESLVGEYRHKLDLERSERAPTARDRCALAVYIAASSLTYIVSVVLPVMLIVLLILWSLGYAI